MQKERISVQNSDISAVSPVIPQVTSKNPFKQQKTSNAVPPQNIQTLTLPNGAIYKGQVKDGKPSGRGNLVYRNGERYEGEFLEGMKHGKGKYYYIKGELYIGDWHQNKKHGKGQYFYENGNRYTGEFVNNMKNGKGRLDEENGSYYEGEFTMNNKDKTGFYFDAVANKKFVFQFENGKELSKREIIDIPLETEEESAEKKIREILGEKVYKSQNDYASEDVQMNLPENEPSSLLMNNFNSEVQQPLISLRNFEIHAKEESEKLIAENYFEKQLLEKKINAWSTKEVSSWLTQIGFGDCIDDFKDNRIEGDSLLFLNNEDLKQLGVTALGDRRILEREIEFLKLIFKSQCLGEPISKLQKKELTFELIEKMQAAQLKQQNKGKNHKNDQEIDMISSSSSSSSDSEEKKPHKKRAYQNMQSKIESYMAKKGIKLTFLIPNDQLQITEPIGKGGYGQVYLGKWLGQEVAVKKYLKKQGFRNKHVGNFIEEIQVINKLLHPSIVLYMGMTINDNEYGMVTEFLSGGSLFDYLHKKKLKLSEEQMLEIMKDVALGMSYLHGKNVLHCDLKSSNVLIDENWNVKLCDFGLSRINSTKNSKKKHIRVGTPHWMAPEILKGEKYECYSDVYSFGILVWEMLTCKIPYKDLSTAQIIGLVGNNENHHISIPKYDNEYILRIFLACTERDVLKRPTFKAIVSELEIAENAFSEKKKQT